MPLGMTIRVSQLLPQRQAIRKVVLELQEYITARCGPANDGQRAVVLLGSWVSLIAIRFDTVAIENRSVGEVVHCSG